MNNISYIATHTIYRYLQFIFIRQMLFCAFFFAVVCIQNAFHFWFFLRSVHCNGKILSLRFPLNRSPVSTRIKCRRRNGINLSHCTVMYWILVLENRNITIEKCEKYWRRKPFSIESVAFLGLYTEKWECWRVVNWMENLFSVSGNLPSMKWI